jgi:hypothetical protein
LRFLDINRYSSHNGTQPKFLVDLLPEIYCGASEARLRRLLSHTNPQTAEAVLRKIEERGSAYLPELNAFYVREFQMMYAAEEVARFLHHACRGLPSRGNMPHQSENPDRSYGLAVEHALGYFGSRVLYPARSLRDEDASLTTARLEKVASDGIKSEALAQQLGYGLGNSLYDAYLEGHVTRGTLRRLFLAQLEKPGKAREICLELVNGVRPEKKKARAAAG